MAPSYRVCGLGLQFNVPVGGLNGLLPHERVDVRVNLGALPRHLEDAADAARDYYVDSARDERGRPCLSVAQLHGGGYYRISYTEGVTVVVDSQGSEVWADWSDALNVEDAASFVTGSLLGFVLRLRGVTCVHGSAVAIDARAIAVVGPSGRGKSSTAAGFARCGYAVLTDDLIALRETASEFCVEPAFPRVHLWPQSVRALFGSSDALPRISPNWDKRRLDLDEQGLRFQRTPLQLAAVYFLDERTAPNGVPVIEAVNPTDALMALVSDSHATEFVGRPQRAAEFDALARLLDRVPARRVMPCADLARIPELCEAIVHDFRRISSGIPGLD